MRILVYLPAYWEICMQIKKEQLELAVDLGKDWRQEEKGVTEDEMVGWHHRLNRHEFEQALGVSDGQESLGMLLFMG